MKIFIWEKVEECTDNYHTDGGVGALRELVGQWVKK